MTLTPLQLVDQLQAGLAQLRVQLQPSAQVTTAAELTAALKVGGTLALAPGLYAGNFVVRVPTTLTGPATAILVPADLSAPVLTVLSHDVTVQGITIRNGAPDKDTVVVGSTTATTVEAQPHRVTFDGVLVQAGSFGGHRAFALHGVDLTVTQCQIRNFWEKGRDAQGIWCHNGPGPYTITANTIEASGESILFGGDRLGIPGVVPTGVIRGNTITKPERWRGTATVKNSIELKNARGVVIEDNVIDGNWKDGQDGGCILLTVRNQYGDSPWCVVDAITIRRNTITRALDGPAVSILGHDDTFPSAQTQTVTIEHNLFVDSPIGIRVNNGVLTSLVVAHNTCPGIRGSVLQFTGDGVTPLTCTDNVVRSGSYGITGDNTTPGLGALVKHAQLVAFTGNVIELTAERTIAYPPGNVLVPPGGLAARLDPVTYKLVAGTAGY